MLLIIMIVACVCPDSARYHLEFRHEPQKLYLNDLPKKKELVKNALEKGAELIVANEFFLDSYSFKKMNEEFSMEYDYTLIAGVTSIGPTLDCSNKLMIYKNDKLILDRLKQYSSDLDEANKILTREEDYSEFEIPTIDVENLTILPLSCCEVQSVFYCWSPRIEKSSDLMTVSAMNLRSMNPKKFIIDQNKNVQNENIQETISELEEKRLLKPNGKVILSDPFYHMGNETQISIIADKNEVLSGEEMVLCKV